MAKITERNQKRYRIYFTLPHSLYKAHQQCMETARELGLDIDFNHDFIRWLSGQLEQVQNDLGKRGKSPSQSNEESTVPSLAAPKSAPVEPVPESREQLPTPKNASTTVDSVQAKQGDPHGDFSEDMWATFCQEVTDGDAGK